MRTLTVLAVLAVSAVVATASISPVLAQDARTIRIEPRPYTSVAVTIENRVRVWRPMPPTALVIVNPGNKANINLGIDVDRRDRGDVINNNVNTQQYFRHRNY